MKQRLRLNNSDFCFWSRTVIITSLRGFIVVSFNFQKKWAITGFNLLRGSEKAPSRQALILPLRPGNYSHESVTLEGDVGGEHAIAP